MADDLINQLQAYLRYSVSQRYHTVLLPPFSLHFHPNDTWPHFNYAIPQHSINKNIDNQLAKLRAEFLRRDCLPRFEFLERFAPNLPKILRQANFSEETRQWMMVCRLSKFKPVGPPPSMVLKQINQNSPVAEIQSFLTIERQGFDPDNKSTITPAEARTFRAVLGNSLGFIGLVQHKVVCVGTLNAPNQGIAEVQGITTLSGFRRRGLASALTSRAVQTAFNQGASLVCLTAADKAAGRIYENLGFEAVGAMLAYSG